MFATARDVTELRRAEEELAKEQRWRRDGHLILESIASEATFSVTPELIVRFVT